MKFNIFLLLLTIFVAVTLAAPLEPALEYDVTPAVNPSKYLTINQYFIIVLEKKILTVNFRFVLF
jgi:hypothetical protein